MITLMLHRLQPYRGSVNFIWAQLYSGVNNMISEEARREVLGRLLKLNHERYEEEVAQGLHEKGAKKGKGKRGGKNNGDGENTHVGRGEQGELVFE